MKNLEDLNALTQMKYQKEQQVLQVFLKREEKLREDLAELRQQEEDGRSLGFDDTNASKALGSDVLWAKWLSKARSALNYELAQVMVQKEAHLQCVRHAYGKVLVSDTLSASHKAQVSSKRQKRNLENALEHFKFRQI